ncbi:hypothetical protein DCAR_0208114 [Daucus carota subsp. sativus]|uniref:X8 domain-containing protein n=1 Tax=Daucus carota subsp. sativus TaxID=79200 RepID=A0A166EBX4_DAUCS|nr:PREDICTED: PLASMODESMATA CALLOSE-BINDING PROTEIN 4 [Daucus carota subsp. sativus]WOG88879.1 hypothetical protein DCAR_0208114 [Daucus carota subsp. sativus]
MPLLLLASLLLLAMAAHSNGASYCLCKDGLSDSVLQKNINYACGAGADCSAINQGGSCFNPNTVKDHCNYAVNSYFQKKGEASGSCDFAGTAAPSPTPPAITNGCVYPSSGSGGTPTTPGTGTPSTGTPGTGTPSTGTPGTGTPSTSTPGMGTPSTGTPGTGTPSTGMPGTGTPGTGIPSTSTPPGTGTSPFLGLGPTGGISNTNPDSSGTPSLHQGTNMFCSIALALLCSSFFYFGALKQE